ncbi:hypothetical protein ACWDA7_51360, partial [Streptomyces sp. NPDC001156]
MGDRTNPHQVARNPDPAPQGWAGSHASPPTRRSYRRATPSARAAAATAAVTAGATRSSKGDG